MTHRIALVGCGFLGSIFLEEFLRRAMAGPLTCEFLLIDDDMIDKRNVANQQYFLDEVGAPKAEASRQRCRWMQQPAEAIEERVTHETEIFATRPQDVIVSAVDNLATRQLLWEFAHWYKVPVLHVGISMQGEGRVEWTHHEHGDTFHLSPVQLAGKEPPKDPVSGQRPPCELVAMRAAGLMTGLAAARSLAIYLGADAEELVGKHPAGMMTTWLTSAEGLREIPELRLGTPDIERLALTAVIEGALAAPVPIPAGGGA